MVGPHYKDEHWEDSLYWLYNAPIEVLIQDPRRLGSSGVEKLGAVWHLDVCLVQCHVSHGQNYIEILYGP